MSRSFLLLSILIGLVFLSCNNELPANQTQSAPTQNLMDTLRIPDLKGLKPDLALTKAAQKEVASWIFYKNLALALDSLSGTTLGELRPRVDQLVEVFDQKENAAEAEAPSTPSAMKTKAIQARIRAIETHVNTLRNLTDRRAVDVDVLVATLVKVKNGFQNLNLQLNERFTKSIKELLDEIQGETRESPI